MAFCIAPAYETINHCHVSGDRHSLQRPGSAHSALRNIENLHVEFAILSRQNKCNHLLFCVLSFIQFCARKLLLLILVLEYFPQTYMLTKCMGRENLELLFRIAPKSICRPLAYTIQVEINLMKMVI